MPTVYSAPNLVGKMLESPRYQTLGVGFTDRIFLMGHADNLPLNDPYIITSVQDAVNKLGADSSIPLLRAMLEVYYGGARDIWLMAVGPRDEYVVPTDDRLSAGTGRGATPWGEGVGQLQIVTQYTQVNQSRASRGAPLLTIPTQMQWDDYNYFERYQARLDIAYELLVNWELPQFLLPVEAPFYDAAGVDFLTQLSTHCADALGITGVIRIGVLGTRVPPDTTLADAIAAMAVDARLSAQGQNGRFVSIVVGEGSFNLKELPTMYSGPLANVAVGLVSKLPLNFGWVYKKLPNVLTLSSPDLTMAQISALTEAQLNPVVRTSKGQRGLPFEVAVATDNTLGTVGTDFWSMMQVRLLMRCIEGIRALSYSAIGTIDFAGFKRAVQQYLYGLSFNGAIRGFDLSITKDPVDRERVLVDVAIQPFFGLRQISFQTAVGPGL